MESLDEVTFKKPFQLKLVHYSRTQKFLIEVFFFFLSGSPNGFFSFKDEFCIDLFIFVMNTFFYFKRRQTMVSTIPSAKKII